MRHLRYFLAVAEELHFGRAAERLHIAQPPLSQAIRKLEQELGVQLLNRTSRVVSLTDAGQALANEAPKVLAAFEYAVSETRRAGGGAASLRLGCIPDLPIERLLSFTTALRRRAPAVDVQVTHLPAGEQITRLRARRLDLAIFFHVEAHTDLESEVLFDAEPLTAYLGPDHELAPKAILGPGDLEGETLVTFPRAANPAQHEQLMRTLADAGYRFAGIHEVGGLYARDLLVPVVEGAGIAVAAASLKEVTMAGSMVVRRDLDPQPRTPEVVIAWRSAPAGQIAETLETLRQAVRDVRDSADT